MFAALASAIACTGVILQLVLSLQLARANGRTVLDGLGVYLSYFTVLTNIFVSCCLTFPLVAPRSSAGRFFARPVVLTSAAASIAVVGVTYFLLLRNVWNPEGWQLVADVVLHYGTPMLFVIHWWQEVPARSIDWAEIPKTLAYPGGYIVYSLIRGAYTSSYPYYFVDVTLLGYPRALVNVAGVLLALALVSATLVAVSRSRPAVSR
jgi:hypothetical protein